MSKVTADVAFGSEGLAYLGASDPLYLDSVLDYLRVSPRVDSLFALRKLYPHWFRSDAKLPVVLADDSSAEHGVCLLVLEKMISGSVDLMELADRVLVNAKYDLRALRIGRKVPGETGVFSKDWYVGEVDSSACENVLVDHVLESSIRSDVEKFSRLSIAEVFAESSPSDLLKLPGYCFMHHIPQFKRLSVVRKLRVEPTCAELVEVCSGMHLPAEDVAGIAAARTDTGWHLHRVEASLLELSELDVVDEVLDKEDAWKALLPDGCETPSDWSTRSVTFGDVDQVSDGFEGNQFREWSEGLVRNGGKWNLIQQMGGPPFWAGKMLPTDLVGAVDETYSVDQVEMVVSRVVEVTNVSPTRFRYRFELDGGKFWPNKVGGSFGTTHLFPFGTALIGKRVKSYDTGFEGVFESYCETATGVDVAVQSSCCVSGVQLPLVLDIFHADVTMPKGLTLVPRHASGLVLDSLSVRVGLIHSWTMASGADVGLRTYFFRLDEAEPWTLARGGKSVSIASDLLLRSVTGILNVALEDVAGGDFMGVFKGIVGAGDDVYLEMETYLDFMPGLFPRDLALERRGRLLPFLGMEDFDV